MHPFSFIKFFFEKHSNGYVPFWSYVIPSVLWVPVVEAVPKERKYNKIISIHFGCSLK
jgi:hypothetical protein